MKLYSLLLLVLFLFTYLTFPNPAASQTQKSDSLQLALEQNTQRDSTRVLSLIKLSFDLLYSNPKKSLQLSKEALDISKELSWTHGIARSYREIGNVYYKFSDYNRAAECFYNALTYSEQLTDKKMSATLYSNLGNIYSDLAETDKAIEYYQKYYDYASINSDTEGIIITLTNIGLAQSENNQTEEGVESLKEALSIAVESKMSNYEALIIPNLGLAYKKNGQTLEALEYYGKALELAENSNNQYTISTILTNMAIIEVKRKEYDSALAKSLKALKIAREHNFLTAEKNALETMCSAYENLGDLNNALESIKKYSLLKDSILNEDKKSELTRKEMSFQMELKEAEDLAEINRQSLIKKFAIGILIFVLLASILFYFTYKKKRDTQLEKQKAEFKAKVLSTELRALRAQMSPHFVFNALNSISNYMMANEPVSASDYLIKFSKLTRAILENSEKKWISLEEDLELIKLYLQIESMRLNQKLQFHIEVSLEIDPDNLNMAPLITQPYVENSVWHGIAPKVEGGTIWIKVKKLGDYLCYIIKDDGVGIEEKDPNLNPNKSMGAEISRSRLEIINEELNTSGTITVSTSDSGVTVSCMLPYILRY